MKAKKLKLSSNWRKQEGRAKAQKKERRRVWPVWRGIGPGWRVSLPQSGGAEKVRMMIFGWNRRSGRWSALLWATHSSRINVMNGCISRREEGENKKMWVKRGWREKEERVKVEERGVSKRPVTQSTMHVVSELECLRTMVTDIFRRKESCIPSDHVQVTHQCSLGWQRE